MNEGDSVSEQEEEVAVFGGERLLRACEVPLFSLCPYDNPP